MNFAICVKKYKIAQRFKRYNNALNMSDVLGAATGFLTSAMKYTPEIINATRANQGANQGDQPPSSGVSLQKSWEGNDMLCYQSSDASGFYCAHAKHYKNDELRRSDPA